MPSDVDVLSQAGFSDEDVENWAAARRATLATAGFSEPEIDNHFGAVHVPPEIPKPFLDRLAQGTAVGRRLGKFGEGFADVFGAEPYGLSDESVSWLQKIGVFRGPEPRREDPLRFMSEALIYPTAKVLDASLHLPGALIWGASKAAGQAMEERGSLPANAMKFTRDINALSMFAFMRFGAEAPLTRLTVHPNGNIVDQPIGTLPRSSDFQIAAKDIAGDAADLATQEKLLRAWTDNGIHPAEIAEDARRDPTIAQAIVSKEADFLSTDLEKRAEEHTSDGFVENAKSQLSHNPLEESDSTEGLHATEPTGITSTEHSPISIDETATTDPIKVLDASHLKETASKEPALPETEWDPSVPRFSQLLDEKEYCKEVLHPKKHRDIFFAKHPELEGHVTVHHAKPRKAYLKYKGVIPIEELHDLDNLRGIPNENNPEFHLSRIHNSWNEFYDDHPNGAAEWQIRERAAEIDRDWGSEFNPPVKREE
jgi:hypothetical protein